MSAHDCRNPAGISVPADRGGSFLLSDRRAVTRRGAGLGQGFTADTSCLTGHAVGSHLQLVFQMYRSGGRVMRL